MKPARCAIAVAIIVGAAIHPRAALADACADAVAVVTIDGAIRPSNSTWSTDQPVVQLGDVIELRLANLDRVYAACDPKKLVLFLNGHPIKGLTPYPPTDAVKDGTLKFTLHTASSPASWAKILGKPDFIDRDVAVSAGMEEGSPFKPVAGGNLPHLKLNVLWNRWFAAWIVFFAVMAFVFFHCVRHTSIIRDGNPLEPAASARGTYSLSKTQGAWWFFVIVASYLLIGIVTGDFCSSINGTALILLGIGAGTVLGSAAIDASKNTPEAREKALAEAAQLKDRLAAIDTQLATIAVNLADNAQQGQHAALRTDKAALTAEKQQKSSLYRKLTRHSEHFITDILSDAEGVNFHRFQIAVWTVVLSIVFINAVYEHLAMPVFDTTLMGLLGLSAGTYLGLKIPEPTTQK